MNRNLKIFLLASLLANALLIGIVAGQFSHGRLGLDFLRPRTSWEEKLTTLPEETRQRVRQAMEKFQQDTKPLREELGQARKETAHLLETEPFDKDAWQNNFKHVQDLRAQMALRMADTIKELAKTMPLEQRSSLVNILRGRSEGREGMRHRRKGDMRPGNEPINQGSEYEKKQ
jgi:uncharacterized membrane protein